MERSQIKLGILTSSRADFGIYQPLLNKLQKLPDEVKTELIVFGTHLSRFHGYTLLEIANHYHFPIHKINGMPLGDSPEAIANGYGNLVTNFSNFWATHTFDWVLALGDRFEMSAAVQGGIPQGVKFAHLHGGETTLGAIDNIYRHQISLASQIHFVATDEFGERVREITHSVKVYSVGALSLDGIEQIQVPAWDVVKAGFNIPVDDFILCTFHPETVTFKNNQQYSEEIIKSIREIVKQLPVIVTLPNADTAGTIFRQAFISLKAELPDRVFLIENFGRLNYFSAMKQASMLLGNTSSGIIEAASFGRFVVNVGERQKGRPQSTNVINVPFEKNDIVTEVFKTLNKGSFTGKNIYYIEGTTDMILNILRNA